MCLPSGPVKGRSAASADPLPAPWKTRPMTDQHHTSTAPASADQEGPSVSTHAATLDIAGPRAPFGLPCHDHPADLWFAELPAQVEAAKALCGDCPIREQCLAGALERAEPWGVWGGQLVLSGVVVPRKRPRGRPRKSDVAA
jgi:WhiB family redox-sensing transcriptional regulator